MEVIRFGESGYKPPLLFVHGSYCGAWIWERYFLPYFAKEGYSGAAISLRGHGKSQGIQSLDHFGIADFVEDIIEGTRLFDRAPILIGHSLGGYLCQRFALLRDVPGMVLLSAPSLKGFGASSQHILMNTPQLAIQLGLMMAFGPEYVDQEVLGRALFLGHISQEQREQMAALFQRESKRVMTEAYWPCWELPRKVPPTLVLGGDQDAFVPVSDFKQEAEIWQAELKILPGVPHAVMLDSCWSLVAGEIKKWLDQTVKPTVSS